jgi:hypothetical protein
VLFAVARSELPRVVAQCKRCATEVVLYDIRKYPSATVVPADDRLTVVAGESAQGANVYVMYEYGPLDPGDRFDSDDITWCQVYARAPESGLLSKVIDHETA